MWRLTAYRDLFAGFDVFKGEDIESKRVVIEAPYRIGSACVVDTLLVINDGS
jgi:hypothetical protein